MLLPACVYLVYIWRTHLFLFWYSPACKYPGECGLHSAPSAHFVRFIPLATSCCVPYHGPELYSDRNIKLEKLYFRSFCSLHPSSFIVQSHSVVQSYPKALAWGIPSNYLLVSLLLSKLPVLFPASWHFMFLSPSIPFKHSTYVNFLCIILS